MAHLIGQAPLQLLQHPVPKAIRSTNGTIENNEGAGGDRLLRLS
jgi:hypothetical protein